MDRQQQAYHQDHPLCGRGRSCSASDAVLRAFIDRGTTARKWAKDHGYVPGTVYACIQLWVPRTDRQPHGGVMREIREALWSELGDDLVPPVATSAVTK